VTLRLLGAAVLVLAACGSGDEGSSGAGGSPPPAADLAGDAALVLVVDVPDPLVAGRPVTWTLTVSNRSATDVTLTFPSSQQGDVALVAPDGREAYRWSDGMMFAQAIVATQLAAGGEETFELTGPLDVPPGEYTLEASATSDPAPKPVTRMVTVDG
jgi:hypothetical protein